MTETTDDLSTPLGQKTERQKRRFRLPFTAMQALAVLLGLFLVAFVTIALFTDNPFGGEPVAHIALRQPARTKSCPQRPPAIPNRREICASRRQPATTRPSPSSTAPAASARMS